MAPFTDKPSSYGVLSFFLLDMGLVAAPALGDLRRGGGGRRLLIGFALPDAPGQLPSSGWRFPCCWLPEQGDHAAVHGALAPAPPTSPSSASALTVPEGQRRASYISTVAGVTFPGSTSLWEFRSYMAFDPTGDSPRLNAGCQRLDRA